MVGIGFPPSIKKDNNMLMLEDLFELWLKANKCNGNEIENLKNTIEEKIYSILHIKKLSSIPIRQNIEPKEHLENLDKFLRVHELIVKILVSKFNKTMEVIVQWDFESLLEELDACIKHEQEILKKISLTNEVNLKEAINWLETKRRV